MRCVFQNFLLPYLVFCLKFTELLALDPDDPASDGDRSDLKTLRQVQVIFRHGDRSPFIEYPLDPYKDESYWPEGFKALTKRGKQREFELGQYIRRRYDGFVRKTYKLEDIYVETSSTDRTVMSALCVLAGLYPVEGDDSRWNPSINWQPIPTHTIADKDDNFINFKASCQRLKDLKREYFTMSEFAQKVNKENRDLYAYLSEHTGLHVTDFELASDLFDTLHIQKANNFSLPAWTHAVYDKMASLFPLPYDSRVIVPTEHAKRIKGGPLLSKIMKTMNLRVSGHDAEAIVPKLHMIAGHDWTVATFLGTLGMFDGSHVPGFGSSVYVELHKVGLPKSEEMESMNLDANNVVKIFYKNSTELPAVQLDVPGCDYPCRFDTFKSLYSHLILDGDEWSKACDSKSIV